jgi:hypothetical protein
MMDYKNPSTTTTLKKKSKRKIYNKWKKGLLVPLPVSIYYRNCYK